MQFFSDLKSTDTGEATLSKTLALEWLRSAKQHSHQEKFAWYYLNQYRCWDAINAIFSESLEQFPSDLPGKAFKFASSIIESRQSLVHST